MCDVLGRRQGAIVRELTKLHEEVCRGELSDLSLKYSSEAPRGEITIIVGPPESAAPNLDRLDALLDKALAFMPVRAAAELVSDALGLAAADGVRARPDAQGKRGKMTTEGFVAIRRAAERRGRRGEFVATLLLIAKG